MFKTKRKQPNKKKHSFHISICFCWFFLEEGLTSCYKNIFIFVTIIEDKSSVRNTAPAKAKLRAPPQLAVFPSLPLSFVPLCLCPCLSLLLTNKQQQMSPNGHVIVKAV